MSSRSASPHRSSTMLDACHVEIVLTTSWLQKLPTERVISYLPAHLVRRVVGTTRDIKPRLSYVLNGSERTS